MGRRIRRRIVVLLTVMLAIGCYFWRFYPQQQMPIGISLGMVTPEPEKYHNDCLRPCVREFGLANYVMVQSPYYA